MDAHTGKTLRVSDPQRCALTFAHTGVLYYRADSFGQGYYGEQDCPPVRIHWQTFEAIERRGWVVREPAGDLSLRNSTVTILAYVLTDEGRAALGVELDEAPDEAGQDEAPDSVDVADVWVGMATARGWVDYVSRFEDGAVIVYFRPFDRSAMTCSAWPPGERLTLVPCPHVRGWSNPAECAKCGAAIAEDHDSAGRRALSGMGGGGAA
ncbi:hypothetical protein I6A60_13560 [Frankia sp. AgB1.9]|uniref:hypothetical protein n=1 Tax=unclassified Frankia TaxID=2632575 RepID=UPI001931E613|nr:MULTISPECIES: hypothetical protein [unclassified Frankia]MBL7494145.1 hypothetical protein [Frankia sp. AgW1.1]MBL7548898.1 hypothetical protein [Frankia sp. AgB1.9]MBL7625203.1 hypothetical protein [Frankia sp. AgB1.8]